MTPNRIREIFWDRGHEAAMTAATACREERLVKLVHELDRISRGEPPTIGKTERRRATGVLNRYAENRLRRAEENRRRAKRAA